MMPDRRSNKISNRFRRWLLEGLRETQTPSKLHHQGRWYNVMCLTGVDYFSTLGYQPSIAFLAAGLLSPLATLVLVLLTLLGALPVYKRVAEESPHGQGTISMLERLLPGWKGKAFVLVLLGFAATDFVITATLSAADATAHIVENPLVPAYLHNRLLLTLLLLAILSGVFLKGFREAIGIAAVLVYSYLALNLVVLGVSATHIMQHLELVSNWQSHLWATYHSPWTMLGLSFLFFPKLALGLSGFETGVAVMPLVKGNPDDNPAKPEGRIRNTHFLLGTAAVIMSIFLLASAMATVLLIPEQALKEGGAANGRALAYLAHLYLGDTFGSIYDVSAIAILAAAGASAITGLLSLVPRYLPRFGMAPDWARAMRPLVLFIGAVCFGVTIIFKANVDAQAGAYATGVLVLITSGGVAATLSVWKEKSRRKYMFAAIALVFIYTTIANMIERPEGLHIAMFFIAAITVTSLVSRAWRSVELRIREVALDETASRLIAEAAAKGNGEIRILAHRPGNKNFREKELDARTTHSIQPDEGDFIFLEVELSEVSDFMEDCLEIHGYVILGYPVLRCRSHAVPNAIAALLLHLRDTTNTIPHAYFGWTAGDPISYIFKYIFFGEGETAPVAREILRLVEHDPNRRPRIHVG
jgi:hypothetical protein